MTTQPVIFSRHARQRMRLYGVTVDQVGAALAKPDEGPALEGSRQVVLKVFAGSFDGLPLKVVYVMEDARALIISAYPLKRRYKRTREG